MSVSGIAAPPGLESLIGASPRAAADVARGPVLGSLPLPKVLLCDLDGTLIDTMPTLADIAAEVMERFYGTPGILARELYLATCGLPFASQLEEIYPGDPRNEDASSTFEAIKPARCNKIEMAADTRRALDTLRAAGVRIVVSSNNGVENVDAFAQASSYEFALTLGFGGGLAKGRPHFDAVSRFFQIDRQQMLFVGDSLHDGAIAEREGVPFVAVATTFTPERFMLRFPHVPVVRRFAALPELFQPSGGRNGRRASAAAAR
ncbi:MAG TPA: HAD hydrolase-like protein [Polyangia bacterium]|nr:HAD hydrolase-like protein [Polyangia bacterium]